jgi:hypothetical protein
MTLSQEFDRWPEFTAHQQRRRSEWATWNAQDADLNNAAQIGGRSRGIDTSPDGPAMLVAVSGIRFLRTTETVTVDAETYTSTDGVVTLHQNRQWGTWRAREAGWGSMGFGYHDTPEGALQEVLDRRAREDGLRRRKAQGETFALKSYGRRRPIATR